MVVSLLPEQTTKPGISLTQDRTVPSDDIVVPQTERAQYALEGTMPPQEISDSMYLGFEAQMRDYALIDEALKDRQRKYQLIENMSNAAAAEGRSLSMAEQEEIFQLSSSQIEANQNTILERLYARRYAEELLQDELSEAAAAAPEATEELRSATEDYTTKQQIALRVLEEIQEQNGQTDWLTTGVDFLEGLVPGLSWARTQSRLEGLGSTSFLGGSNLEEQMRGLYLLSPEEFELRLREAVQDIRDESIFDAAFFAQAAVEYSSADALWGNIFATMDAADVATLGGTVAVGALASAARRARSAVSAGTRGDSVSRMVSQGNIEGASEVAVNKRLIEDLRPTSEAVQQGITRPQRIVDELTHTIPGMLDANAATRNAGSLSIERQRRLEENIAQSKELLVSTLTDIVHDERINDSARNLAFAAAERRFLVVNHKLEDAIVEIRPVTESQDVFGGVDHIKVLIGRKDASGFKKESQAQFHASNMYRLAPGSYQIEAIDGNYFITMTQNVDETALDVQLSRVTTDNAAPETFVNTWIGWLRTPDDVLSPEHNARRKALTFGANAVMARLQQSAQNLGSLGKNQRNRLKEILEEASFKSRDLLQPDGTTKKVAGVFYETVEDVEKAYLAKGFGLPSDKELAAYFEFRNIMDWDLAQKNISVYRDKARLGIEQYSVSVSDGKRYSGTPFFEGRVVESLPNLDEGDFTVGWVRSGGKKPGQASFGIAGRMPFRVRQGLEELLQSGDYKIIQLADPKNSDLRRAFNTYGEPLQYVVVKDVKQKPLSMLQVPRNEGGHWMYPLHGNYIKQAQVHPGSNRWIYDGDTTAFAVPSSAVGRKLSEAMEIGRRMVREGAPGLDDFVSKNLPFKSGNAFAKMFRTADNKDAPFSLETPFVLTEGSQSTKDVSNLRDILQGEVFDSMDNPNSLSALLVNQYTQQRGERLLSVDSLGTDVNPIYKFSPAQMLDPFEALSRSAAQMARSRFFDDYKHSAVENWISQFASVLDVPIRELRADPIRYLKRPVYKDSTDRAKIAAAKANRRAILRLMNMEGEDSAAWKYTRQKVVDEVYKRAGKKGSKIVDPILWDERTDVPTILRSAVFHAKLGLMNVAQLVLQSMGAVNAIAIGGNPIIGTQAPFAYWGMRMRGLSEINPKGQGAITKAVANALGIGEDTLDEMYDAWKRSGVYIIEGEYAQLDDFLNPKMFQDSRGRKALHVGATFFREGNNVHRGTAFAYAFLEWRRANPKARLDNRALRQITDRTDLMYINMTRASNAVWQGSRQSEWWQKALSVPAQFFGYHARLTELMLSHRLTGTEKLRLFGVNSLMWGVPIGGFGTVLGAFWPVGESIKESMISQGIDGDSNAVTRLLVDGGADMLVEYLTGEDFNVAERFGPSGLTYARDFLEGNFGELFGASLSFTGEMMRVAEPFWSWGAATFQGENITLSQDDFINVLKEASSFNNAHRALMAYTAGEWLTKKGDLVANVEAGDPQTAIAIALGLTPQDITDMYLMMRDNKSVAEHHQKIADQAIKEYTRAMKAAANGDFELARQFRNNAAAWMRMGDFTPMEANAVFDRAMRETETMMESVTREFWLNDPENRPNPVLMED